MFCVGRAKVFSIPVWAFSEDDEPSCTICILKLRPHSVYAYVHTHTQCKLYTGQAMSCYTASDDVPLYTDMQTHTYRPADAHWATLAALNCSDIWLTAYSLIIHILSPSVKAACYLGLLWECTGPIQLNGTEIMLQERMARSVQKHTTMH